MTISKTTTDLSTLKINYLTQEMYEDALENEEINENELYITPGGGSSDDLLIVQFTYDENLDEYTCTTTPQAIAEASRAGKNVVGYTIVDEEYSFMLYLVDTNIWEEDGTYHYECYFSSQQVYNFSSNQLHLYAFKLVYSDNGGYSNIYWDAPENFSKNPTSSYGAVFDSTARMNSTDMTSQEVSSFINSLDLDGSTIHRIYISTSDPTPADGNNGDVWFKYEEPEVVEE